MGVKLWKTKTHKPTIPVLYVDENVSVEKQIAAESVDFLPALPRGNVRQDLKSIPPPAGLRQILNSVPCLKGILTQPTRY